MAQCDKERKLPWNSLQRYQPRQVAIFWFAETLPAWSFVSVTVISLIGTKLHLSPQLGLLRVLPRREVEQLNHFAQRSDQLRVINHFTGVNTANRAGSWTLLFQLLRFVIPASRLSNVRFKSRQLKEKWPALMLRIL